MRSVDVCMCFIPAGGAPEHVPLAGSQKPAPGAGLARVGRIDLGHPQTAHLRFALDGRAELSPRQERRLLPRAKARGSRRRVIGWAAPINASSCTPCFWRIRPSLRSGRRISIYSTEPPGQIGRRTCRASRLDARRRLPFLSFPSERGLSESSSFLP